MQAVYSQMETISRRAIARNRRTTAPLTVVQHTLLTFIASTSDCRAIDIAGAFRLNRSTISRQVADLVGLDLVVVRVDGVGGGRGQVLELTGRGHELLESSVRANRAELERRLTGWDDDEVDRLARGLERFNAVEDE